MTTTVSGSNYDGPINQVINGGSGKFFLGNDPYGVNVTIELQDTNKGAEYKITGGARLSLKRRGLTTPLIGREGIFAGGEGLVLDIKNTAIPENKLEISYKRGPER